MIWLLLVPVALLLFTLGLLVTLWLVGERGHLILPSTKARFRAHVGERGGGPLLRIDGTPAAKRPARNRGMQIVDGLHAYVYGRWTDKYVGFCLKHLLPRASEGQKKWWADHYHGKVLPPELAKSIITLDHDIPRTDLEQVVPYLRARDIVLKASPDVTVMDCPCRLNQEDPCHPLDVCMVVGGGDFVLDHLPHRSRRVSRDEALAILDAEHERGHVHTAYFKDAVGDRFYAICNCCSCCCGGLEAMKEHGVPMLASSGYVAEVDPDLCIACGDCVDACPFDAMEIQDDLAVVHWTDCMGCGVCEGQCTTGGMSLKLDEGKGIPLDVRELGIPPASA